MVDPIEQEILNKGLTAPRITMDAVEDNIVGEYFFTAMDGHYGVIHRLPEGSLVSAAMPNPALSLLTFCVLVLKNGFTVTGESACASPENFDAEVGRMIARRNAVDKIWPLMGYGLKSKLHQLEQHR